jgi:hypothetical protein
VHLAGDPAALRVAGLLDAQPLLGLEPLGALAEREDQRAAGADEQTPRDGDHAEQHADHQAHPVERRAVRVERGVQRTAGQADRHHRGHGAQRDPDRRVEQRDQHRPGRQPGERRRHQGEHDDGERVAAAPPERHP